MYSHKILELKVIFRIAFLRVLQKLVCKMLWEKKYHSLCDQVEKNCIPQLTLRK